MNIRQSLEPERPNVIKGVLALFSLNPCKVKEVLFYMSEWKRFEEEKRKLAEKGLSSAEYQKAVQKLAKKYKI